MSSIDILNKRLESAFEIKEFYDPFFIAEIGINHNGSLKIAKDLIDMATLAGCDAVKFQKRTIDIVYSEEVLSSSRKSPWGETTRDQKEGLEFSYEDYVEIDKYCKNKNILWSASAWDKNSQDFLKEFNLPFNKVASAMATNIPFLEYVAKEQKPTFVSTGMMKDENINQIVDIFKRIDSPLCLFHTVSVYPSPEDELNLLLIKKLKENHHIPTGYSGHEASVMPSVIAAALGASSIERHITLDRAMYGSDQSASLESTGLTTLLNTLRKYSGFLGSNKKVFSDQEKVVAEKLRYWQEN